jgi:hypothetical protein
MTEAAAFLHNARLDNLATNHLGCALYSDLFASASGPANNARYIFLQEESRDVYVDWERAATGQTFTYPMTLRRLRSPS